MPPMDFKDYYKILGVEPTADDKAIKAAYRKLARKYHPDVSKEKDAEAKFKDASEAYEALKSADKRAEYDDLRKYGQHGQPFQGPPGWQSRGGYGGGGGGYGGGGGERSSGARGWEDRSYGNRDSAPAPAPAADTWGAPSPDFGGGEPSRDGFDDGRSRRRRGGDRPSSPAPSEDWGDYGGAEG